MKELIYQIIKENEKKGNFTYAEFTEEMCKIAEQKLGEAIPEEYKWFLKEFGHGGIGGVEVIGITRDNKILFVEETIKFRTYGLPSKYIVIENCDEWVYCINTKNSEVVMWTKGDKEIPTAYKGFIDYLADRTNDMLENT